MESLFEFNPFALVVDPSKCVEIARNARGNRRHEASDKEVSRGLKRRELPRALPSTLELAERTEQMRSRSQTDKVTEQAGYSAEAKLQRIRE